MTSEHDSIDWDSWPEPHYVNCRCRLPIPTPEEIDALIASALRPDIREDAA